MSGSRLAGSALHKPSTAVASEIGERPAEASGGKASGHAASPAGLEEQGWNPNRPLSNEGTRIARPDGLTDEEGVVSDHLVAAVEAWARLLRQHPQEINEFIDGIHRCQGLLTTRIARRHYPDGWPVKT